VAWGRDASVGLSGRVNVYYWDAALVLCFLLSYGVVYRSEVGVWENGVE